MSRLIDADKLTKQMDDDFAEAIKNGTDTLAFAEARNFLLNILVKQDVIDAVEVVRCKDCKYRSELLGNAPFMFYSCTHNRGLFSKIELEGFCSYGERKE